MSIRIYNHILLDIKEYISYNFVMDKLRFLKRVENTRTYRLLSSEELKLFLLLLICADGTEVKETIDLRLLRKAMGEEITLDKFKTMASNLKKHGMADIVIHGDKKRLSFILHEVRNE